MEPGSDTEAPEVTSGKARIGSCFLSESTRMKVRIPQRGPQVNQNRILVRFKIYQNEGKNTTEGTLGKPE